EDTLAGQAKRLGASKKDAWKGFALGRHRYPESSGEAISDTVELLKPAQWSERGEGRRSRAPARDNPAERIIVDRFDVLDDLKRIKWRAVDQKMLRQLFAARGGALERH